VEAPGSRRAGLLVRLGAACSANARKAKAAPIDLPINPRHHREWQVLHRPIIATAVYNSNRAPGPETKTFANPSRVLPDRLQAALALFQAEAPERAP